MKSQSKTILFILSYITWKIPVHAGFFFIFSLDSVDDVFTFRKYNGIMKYGESAFGNEEKILWQ